MQGSETILMLVVTFAVWKRRGSYPRWRRQVASLRAAAGRLVAAAENPLKGCLVLLLRRVEADRC